MQFFNRENPIGVFDSGIGGLTVVKRLNQFMPNENIVYFGDTARVPYGNKSNDTVIEYANEDVRFLLGKNVKLIVVACNTASSVALTSLQENFDIPIIGMIEPGAKKAIKISNSKKIGVIGTYATVNNHAYAKKLKELDPKVEVFEKACPLFVPLAEEGLINHPATKLIAEEYLAELKAAEIDTLILGCTHYPILAETIQEIMGKNVTLIDSGEAASEEVEKYLEGRGLKNNSNQIGKNEFYVSDIQTKFEQIAKLFLGKELDYFAKIELEELLRK